MMVFDYVRNMMKYCNALLRPLLIRHIAVMPPDPSLAQCNTASLTVWYWPPDQAH